MVRKRKLKRWIQGATKKSHKGALHRQLGIPIGDTIPVSTLRRAARKKGKLGRRARFALTMRRLRLLKKRK